MFEEKNIPRITIVLKSSSQWSRCLSYLCLLVYIKNKIMSIMHHNDDVPG